VDIFGRAWEIRLTVLASLGRTTMFRFAICVAALALATPSFAESLPKRVGQCVTTRVERVETRLLDGSNQPVPGSGSAIVFVNGGYQVSYDQIPAVDASRPGDTVNICLVSIPQGCPPGDHRGREYKTTNLRTKGSWTLPDAEHSCGGA
jgi:hypothetical protein